MYNVTVLSRTPITTYPKLNVPLVTMYVTYVSAGLSPGTVTIEKAKYSKALEKKLVREDIEKRLKRKAEIYTV